MNQTDSPVMQVRRRRGLDERADPTRMHIQIGDVHLDPFSLSATLLDSGASHLVCCLARTSETLVQLDTGHCDAVCVKRARVVA